MKTVALESTGIRLPRPAVGGGMALAEALAHRRSRREFEATPLSREHISQLCWAAQGVTGPDGMRTAPSAAALYPLKLLVVEEAGLSEYEPGEHALLRRTAEDMRASLQRAALDQPCVGSAAVCFVIAMQIAVLAGRYGERSTQYCLLEAGHVAQNLLLQATALGLGAVPVGAFKDQQVDRALGLPAGVRTVYLLPVGFPARNDR